MLTNSVRVLHVVPGLEPRQGGPAYTVPKLCESLEAAGVTAKLYTVAQQNDAEYIVRQKPTNSISFKWNYPSTPIISGLRISAALSRRLRTSSGQFDIYHMHGLWTWPSVTTPRFSKEHNAPFVLSPRGMLSPGALRISALKKLLFWKCFQKAALRNLACFHATSELEGEELRAFGSRNELNVPIAVIPNGIDVFDLPARSSSEPLYTILSLGRIHPKKGLDVLIRAWARIFIHRPSWRLRIVGSDEVGHAKELRRLVQRLGVDRVSIEGPYYDDEKIRAYRNADIFVLPSRSENFGMTVIEALAAERPVIATKTTPWASLVDNGCGWWIGEGEDCLVAALQTATALPHDKLLQMGAQGRAYVSRAFQWEIIGQEMALVYKWLLQKGPLPPFVRLPYGDKKPRI